MRAVPPITPTTIPPIAPCEIPFDGVFDAVEGVECVGAENNAVVVVWKILMDI